MSDDGRCTEINPLVISVVVSVTKTMQAENPESTAWEERYQVRDTPWEKGAAAPPLLDYLKTHRMEGKVLVPGCGSGHDVRAIASQGAEVVGLDFAPSAIVSARSYPKEGGETYVQADLFQLPDRFRGTFDWVFEHTCFCAIPLSQRPSYARSIFEALKNSANFLGIFYMNPDLDEGHKGPPYPSSPEELSALFDPFFTLESKWIPATAYPGREGRELVKLLRRKDA
jgi:SAM-dependent methyltransferase